MLGKMFILHVFADFIFFLTFIDLFTSQSKRLSIIITT